MSDEDRKKNRYHFDRHTPEYRTQFEKITEEIHAKCPVAWTDTYEGHWVAGGSQAVFLLEEVVGRALVGVVSEANKLGSRTDENRQRGLWEYPPPGPWMVLVNPDQRERFAVSFEPTNPVVECVGSPGSDEGTEYRNTDHPSTGRSNFTKASSAPWRYMQFASRVGSWGAGNERTPLRTVGAREEFDKGSEALVSPGRIG